MGSLRCRFCKSPADRQEVKGKYVYGGPTDTHFWKCGDCQMVYLWPLMNEVQEKEFYAKEFEKFMGDRAGKDKNWSGPHEHVKSNAGERVRREKWLPMEQMKGKRVLEVGCSSGFLLSSLREAGAEVFGIEPSGLFSNFVRNQGIPVYEGVEDFTRAGHGPVDLVLHYYVLEHIREPENFLGALVETLRPGGQMIYEVPCVTDPLVELYKVPAFENFYWSYAHHWYYSRDTMAQVLKKVGVPFELFPEQRYDLSNHLVWALTGKPGGMGHYSNVFSKTTEDSYKEDLKRNWLCDTIVAKLQR